jgi:hypothetical protein
VADVFISYKREERQAVERLAQELRRLGLDVWFDASLNAGEAFSDEIDREAHAAKAILVCWSPTARESQWVKSEALIGFEQRKLAACYVAGPDGFYPPTPFNSIHAEDLRAWVGTPSNTHAGYKSILRRIGSLCGRADIESYGALDVQAPPSTLRASIERHQSSPLFMVVDELLHVRDVEEAERARLEQEARERRAREEAERRAREDAARRAREEQEHRERAEREERARQEREAQAARDADAARRALWITGGVVAAFVIGIILIAGQDQGPPAEQTKVQEPQAQREPQAQPATDPCDEADAQWVSLRSSRHSARVAAFVENTPDSCNAHALARALLAELLQTPPVESRSSSVNAPANNFELTCSLLSNATPASLRTRYGAENVSAERVHIGEGQYYEATVLFASDPVRRLEFVWYENALWTIRVLGSSSTWVGPSGLRLGQTLQDVEYANAAPFTLTGWGWDLGGRAYNWGSGALSRERCRILVQFDRRGRPAPMGDADFASNSVAVRNAEPVVVGLMLSPRD